VILDRGARTVAAAWRVYDHGAIIARDVIPSNVHWPETTLDFARPTRLRLMLCNLGRELAVQAAVRR
jgi:hypothetical protein